MLYPLRRSHVLAEEQSRQDGLKVPTCPALICIGVETRETTSEGGEGGRKGPESETDLGGPCVVFELQWGRITKDAEIGDTAFLLGE